MAAPLKDFRGKITAEADCVLEAINRATGKDRSEIVRDVLHAWALGELDKHTVLAQLLRAEGLDGAYEGIAGNRREDEGARGRRRA